MHREVPPPPGPGAVDPSATDSSADPASTSDTIDLGSPRAVAARVAQRGEPLLEAGGQIGDRYTVLGVLGKGGMGVVYAVYDAKLDRRVALKLLRSGRHATSGGDAEARRGRLLREAQAMARLNHPNVVSVYDVGSHADDVFVAMELVEGETLRAWLKAERRDWRQILTCFVAAGRGLAAAHAAGMIHRDFKADNVLVGRDGRVRVTDFGVVRLDCDVASEPPATEGRPLEPGTGSSDAWKIALTEAGTAPGTPRYMAPEIFDGKTADARSDLFAFCVVLYEALCDVHPFEGETAFGTVEGARRPHPPRPGGGHAAAPAWLVRAIERGLRRAPEERPPSMEALLAELTPRSGRERMRWIGAGAALLVLCGVTATVGLAARTRALERAQLCQGGPGRVAAVWDSAIKGRLRDALLATGKPYAADVWKSVETNLDSYGARWARMHKDSCEATQLRGEQTGAIMTLRMACLDRKLTGFSALVDVLSGADVAMLEKAAPAAAGLSSLDACADVPALMSEMPPPTDPVVRQQIAAIHTQLSRAAAYRLAGRVADSSKRAEAAIGDARKTGDAAILAEALAEAGQAQLSIDPARGATLLAEAFGAAFSSHLDRIATASAIRLMVAYALTGRKEDSATWERYAQAGLARIGGDDELESELWLARGHTYEEAGKFNQVLDAYAHAQRLLERLYGPDDLRTLRQQNNVILALANSHRVLDARPLRAALLVRQQTALGLHHPVVGRTLGEMAVDDAQLGHFDEARAHLGRAVQIYTDAGALGTRHWMVIRYEAMAVAVLQGRMADGAADAHNILTMLDGWSMADSEVAYETRAFLGRAQLGLGQTAEATLMLRHTLEQLEHSHGKSNMIAGPVLGALAEACARSGRVDEAIALVRRNIAILLGQSGEGSFDVAEARVDLARLLVVHGSAAEALALVDANEGPLLRAVGADGPSVITVRRARGEALLALGRVAEGTAALEEALATATRDGLDPTLRKELQADVAKARLRAGAKLTAR